MYPRAALAEVGRHAACLSTYKDHEIRAAHHLIGAPPTVGFDHAHRALRRWSRGASRIGRATARLLLDEGAVVTIADIEDEKLAAATATLSRNGSLTAVNCDVPSMTQARSAVDRAVAAHGHLDVVVCAAGIPSRSGIEALEEEDCDRVLAVNLKSIFTVVKAAVRHLRQHGGTIVTIGQSLRSTPIHSPPCTTPERGRLCCSKALALDLIRYGDPCQLPMPGNQRYTAATCGGQTEPRPGHGTTRV